MKIFYEELSDVIRYIENQKYISLEEHIRSFDCIVNRISKFKSISHNHLFLEVGIGTGWFPILCQKNGITCKGIDISPQLVGYAKSQCQENGVDPDIIDLANIENENIGKEIYDVIIANSVFEHIQYWQIALERVFEALKPGGLFYFYSTNKFSLRSGEFHYPLYGWLPNAFRYRLRMSRQGADIMKLGIDFNQFTYPKLRRFFNQIGFTKIFDAVDILDSDNLGNPNIWKKILLKILKKYKFFRSFALTFGGGTLFICAK